MNAVFFLTGRAVFVDFPILSPLHLSPALSQVSSEKSISIKIRMGSNLKKNIPIEIQMGSMREKRREVMGFNFCLFYNP